MLHHQDMRFHECAGQFSHTLALTEVGLLKAANVCFIPCTNVKLVHPKKCWSGAGVHPDLAAEAGRGQLGARGQDVCGGAALHGRRRRPAHRRRQAGPHRQAAVAGAPCSPLLKLYTLNCQTPISAYGMGALEQMPLLALLCLAGSGQQCLTATCAHWLLCLFVMVLAVTYLLHASLMFMPARSFCWRRASRSRSCGMSCTCSC